jgi:hypothetical protein
MMRHIGRSTNGNETKIEETLELELELELGT